LEVRQENLSAAKRHAAQGEIHIAAQKRIIADLLAIGSNTADAEKLLLLFEQTQDNHLNHIDRLLDLLDKLPLFEQDTQP
jgi:hypothetical protein